MAQYCSLGKNRWAIKTLNAKRLGNFFCGKLVRRSYETEQGEKAGKAGTGHEKVAITATCDRFGDKDFKVATKVLLFPFGR